MVRLKKVGNYVYLVGDTYPIKDELKSFGAMWSSAKKTWYLINPSPPTAKKVARLLSSLAVQDRGVSKTDHDRFWGVVDKYGEAKIEAILGTPLPKRSVDLSQTLYKYLKKQLKAHKLQATLVSGPMITPAQAKYLIKLISAAGVNWQVPGLELFSHPPTLAQLSTGLSKKEASQCIDTLATKVGWN